MLVNVFQDICRTTGNIALALQAHLTTLMLMGYYDRILEFDDIAPADMRSFVRVLMPQEFNGLIAVTSVTCVHLLLTIAVLCQFLCWTRYSTLGNAWQTVTQVYSSDTERIFDLPSVVSDREVEMQLASEERISNRVILRVLSNSNKIGVETINESRE
jgi:hypothetical protein